MVVTANGVDPDEFTNDYAYRGVCLAPAEFSEGSKKTPIAYTMQGKMQQMNTGDKPIYAGDEVEYYALSVDKAREFMLTHKTKRVPLGLRKLQPLSSLLKRARTGPAGITKETLINRRERLFGVAATEHGHMRRLRGNVIGTALNSAAPGGHFDILLKPPV